MTPESLEETEGYIRRCLDEKGFFFHMERDRDKYPILKVVRVLDRMKENKEIEEEWFNLPDREGASTWAKVAFPKGKVPKNIEDVKCSDCERPYFAEAKEAKTIKIGLIGLMGGIIKKDFNPGEYDSSELDVKEFDLIETKDSKVEVYFSKKGETPHKMSDIRCKNCQRPYFLSKDVEEVKIVLDSEGNREKIPGKDGCPIYI